MRRRPFFRIAPFPHSDVDSCSSELIGDGELDSDLAELIRRHRVGGSYWAAQPDLPDRYWVVRGDSDLGDASRLAGRTPIVLWPDTDCDPWHMLGRAAGLVCRADDDAAIVAQLLGVQVWTRQAGGSDLSRIPQNRPIPAEVMAPFPNPFTGQAMTLRETIELCSFWRRLIDSNRGIAGGVGFAFWKQAAVAPLLWDGSKPFEFLSAAPERAEKMAVWRAKTPPSVLAELDRRGVDIVEVEDGFLRSSGLGADCVPPLSIIVDRLGAYFDPAQPSELELLIQNGGFDAALIERARALRRRIVEAGLGKYERGSEPLQRPGGDRVHILVPGQVEDDRSVQTGGAGLHSNLELLRRVRSRAPDAFMLYKPHPDVLAGHRKGDVDHNESRRYADQIVSGASIASLLEMVDQVHVNTSLAGFEALLRDKPVTTYGVPFYAGWGLTTDLGPVPSRRTARPTIDELAAAALLIYPRYLDPVTGLPCPAEIAVDRLLSDDGRRPGPVVTLRRLQGAFMRLLRGVGR
jgi:capsular polysaccharide export protein